MKRRRVVPVMAVCLTVLLTTAASAAEDVLTLIPKDALGFVVFNRLADVDAKIQTAARQMELPPASPLAKFKELLKIQQGLDEEGTAAIAVMSAEDDRFEPTWLLYLPVTDFGKFIERMKPDPDDRDARVLSLRVLDDCVVGRVGSYAVFPDPSHRAILKRVFDLDQSVADQVAFLRPWMNDNDVAAVMTSRGVKLLCQKAQEGLREARTAMERVGQEENPALGILKVYKGFFATAEDEVSAVALGALVDEHGALKVTSRTRLASGGELAGSVAKVEPREADMLAGLPAGPFVLAFAASTPQGAMEGLMQFSGNMMKAMRGLYGLSDEQVDQMMEQSRESMEGVRRMSMVLGVGESDDPLYGNMLFVMSVDDAQAYLKTYGELIGRMNDLMKDSDSPIKWTLEMEEVKVAGLPALKVAMEFPLFGSQKIPELTGLMEKMFGPGGKMTFFLAAVDDQTVVGAYTSAKSLRRGIRAVRQPKRSLATDEGIAKTAAMLPSQAPCVGYWSPGGTVDFINRAIALFVPGPEVGFKLPPFPQTPPVGFAVTTSPNEVQTHMVVPAEVIQAIGRYVIQLRPTTGGSEAE